MFLKITRKGVMMLKDPKFCVKLMEIMEVTPKSLNIGAKVLTHRSNTMWDILLPMEDVAKSLTGNIPTSKSVGLQTEYMGCRKTEVALHGVPLYISVYLLGFFSSPHLEKLLMSRR